MNISDSKDIMEMAQRLYHGEIVNVSMTAPATLFELKDICRKLFGSVDVMVNVDTEMFQLARTLDVQRKRW